MLSTSRPSSAAARLSSLSDGGAGRSRCPMTARSRRRAAAVLADGLAVLRVSVQRHETDSENVTACHSISRLYAKVCGQIRSTWSSAVDGAWSANPRVWSTTASSGTPLPGLMLVAVDVDLLTEAEVVHAPPRRRGYPAPYLTADAPRRSEAPHRLFTGSSWR